MCTIREIFLRERLKPQLPAVIRTNTLVQHLSSEVNVPTTAQNIPRLTVITAACR
jgi:hypothetical protein